MNYPIRINKYLRDKNIASRREADELVEKGLVMVNKEIVDKGYMVKEEDVVSVKDYEKNYQYFAYYKPRGLPTQDLFGRKSVVTMFKEKGLYPVGRLDKESEGLIFLTNDGRFTRQVLSQKKEFEKEYLVTVREKLQAEVREVFLKGMKSKTFGPLLPARVEIVDDHSLKIVLNEGKRHQIRVMLSELSYTVTSLKRVRIGDVSIGSMKPGEILKIKVNI